jgi:ADP-ribose pyrophosphatase
MKLRQVMSIPAWKTVETRYLHPGIRIDRCELPDGRIVHAQILEYDDEVMVFALTKTQEVVLIEQYRHGLQKSIVEFPGGSVDQGESPLEAAKRELFEETGYVGNTFIEVGHGSPNPAIYTNTIYYFLALDVEQMDQNRSEAVTIKLLLMPLDEVIHLARKRDLTHSLNLSLLFFVLGYLNRLS